MADDNYNPEFEDPEIVDEAKTAIENKAKNVAETAGKTVVRAAGKVAIKAVKWLVLKILAILLWIFLHILLPIIIALLPLIALWAILTLVKGNFEKVQNFFTAVFDLPQYDNDALNAWNNGGDPEKTYQIYMSLKETDDKKKKESDDTAEDSSSDLFEDEDMKAILEDESFSDLMRPENLWLSPKDTLEILDECVTFNKEIFRSNWHKYEYHEWRLEKNIDLYGAFIDYTWEEYPSEEHGDAPVGHTSEDNIYGIVTNENVWGEEWDGQKIYSLHWTDVMAFAYYYSMEKSDDEEQGHGTGDDSTYVPNEGTEYEINNTDNYYYSDIEGGKERVYNLFKFHGSNNGCRWSAVMDNGHQNVAYKWEKLSTNPRIAYRYSRVADPTDWGPFTTDPPAYDGEWVTPTKFVPDSAPGVILNKIETNTYQYISTEDVPGYTPDPENFTPPAGEYCIGKWRVFNPDPFVYEMASMCDWYLKRDSEKMREQMNYNWGAEMMDMYIYYLQLIEEGLGTDDRTEYYKHVKELYVNNQIEIQYYGMKPTDEVIDVFVSNIAAEYPDKEIVINFDHAVDYGEFYSVTEADPKEQAKNGTIPFPSYGVTFHGNDPEKEESGNSDVEHDYVGDVFISESNGHNVNGWIHLIEGADTPLDAGYYYTRDQIYAMIQKLYNSKTSEFDWLACVDDVYEYNQATGADISALLAIILTEYSPKIGNPTYNWYNLTAGSGEPYFKTSAGSKYNWWNPREQFQGTYKTMNRRGGGTGYKTLQGCCMVECMDSIVRRFWGRGQNTFYTMCFNQYGYPQSWEEAEAAKGGISHAYCPWWDDTGFITTGYNSDYMWCNKNAVYRTSFRHAAGLD